MMKTKFELKNFVLVLYLFTIHTKRISFHCRLFGVQTKASLAGFHYFFLQKCSFELLISWLPAIVIHLTCCSLQFPFSSDLIFNSRKASNSVYPSV
jgi:hypothetical protein